MNKIFIIILCIALALVIIGATVAVVALKSVDFDFSVLNTVEYEEKTRVIDEEFDIISVNNTSFNVRVSRSADGVCKVTYPESEGQTYVVEVEDGVLSVNEKNTEKWFKNIGIRVTKIPDVVIWLPEEKYTSLSIDTTSGNVDVPADFTFKSVRIVGTSSNISSSASSEGAIVITTTSGNISMNGLTAETVTFGSSSGNAAISNVSCGSLNSHSTSGVISLKKVTARENFFVKSTSGNIKLDRCDGKNISITATSGNVSGSILSEKLFNASSSSGVVKVPPSSGSSTGECVIKTTSGNIKLEIEKSDEGE